MMKVLIFGDKGGLKSWFLVIREAEIHGFLDIKGGLKSWFLVIREA